MLLLLLLMMCECCNIQFPFGGQSRRTVQCAAVERSDVNRASVCGGVGHIINQVCGADNGKQHWPTRQSPQI